MIEAETETAEIPIKKTAQVVLPMGSTSSDSFDDGDDHISVQVLLGSLDDT